MHIDSELEDDQMETKHNQGVFQWSFGNYWKFHCEDKMILWPSYLHNGISYTWWLFHSGLVVLMSPYVYYWNVIIPV